MKKQFIYNSFNPNPYEVHALAMNEIKPGSTVLELGCATGYITQELLKKQCKVTAYDVDREALKVAKKIHPEVFYADFNDVSTITTQKTYDNILLLDVIEHLIKRQELLKYVRPLLNPKGKLLLSTPNIAHIRPRLQLLRGRFRYESIGVMDETHVHFYTQETLVAELKKAGFTKIRVTPSADLGQVPLIGRLLRKLPKQIQYQIVSLWPTGLAVQWFVTASA